LFNIKEKTAIYIDYSDDGLTMTTKMPFLSTLKWALFSRRIVINNPKKENKDV